MAPPKRALPFLLWLFAISPQATPQSLQPDIFINAGVSSFFTDFQGNGWVGDEITDYYNVGAKGEVSAAIEGTFEDIIYQTERWDSESDGIPMKYEIPVQPGSYQVVLHFAEVYLKAQFVNARVFNVSIQGEVAFPYVDIFAEAGGGFTALTKEATTTVKEGEDLVIEFAHILQNPKICGIEIRTIFVPSVLVNCGGPSVVDDEGLVWTSDFYTGYNNVGVPNLVSGSIEGTPNEVLYRTGRWLPTKEGNELVYEIPILNGVYDVYLHWAETYKKTQAEGKREFDVFVQKELAFDNLDIYREAGGGYKALRLKTTATVVNDLLIIELKRGALQNPKLCAIEIHPQGRRSTPTLPGKTLETIYINAGTKVPYTDGSNIVWAPDDFYTTGNTYYKKGLDIKTTSDPEIYRSHRWDSRKSPNLEYNIPVSEGEYTVKLHFCETFSRANKAGYRVFNVAMEGDIVFENVDIFAEVGLYSAMTLTATVNVLDGALTIEFLHVVQNPLISAIEISPNFNLAPPETIEFDPIRINAGAKRTFTDSQNKEWVPDAYFNGGKTFIDETKREIVGTVDDSLYHSERWADTPFTYEVPLPDGSFKVTLHFAELYSKAQRPNQRVFDVMIEGITLLDDLDIFKQVGGNATLVKDFPVDVYDGALTIDFVPGIQNPKVSAIEIVSIGQVKVHQAHAVPGGPYIGTDSDNDGREIIPVDGRFSHTHGPGARLVLWNWKLGNAEIGFGESTNLTLPVGFHNVSLEVRDSEGDTQTSYTNITVRPFGFPVLDSTEPSSGDIAGGDVITLSGQGFNFTAASITVHFGEVSVTGSSAITTRNARTLEVTTPPGIIAGLLDVSVETPIGRSNAVGFTYIDGEAVTFKPPVDLYLIGGGPTNVLFGPDERLYISTQSGDIIRLTLDENYSITEELVSKVVGLSEPPYRVILGLAFDPLDTGEYPTLYVAHSFLFHKQDLENSYNGKISKLSGQNLDKLEHVITGLPVSDHDHGINGLEFGDDGELYIQIGGNTNAGVPGPISSRETLGEGYFSAATVVAYLARDKFDGFITYDDSTGYPITGLDVEVFASGQRNPYDIVLHSNGNLYATDNGPNDTNGKVSTSCTTSAPDPKMLDKLNLIRKGHYYGHANRLRGKEDPRQCIWRNGEQEESDDDFTAPMLILPPSSNGIIEYASNHFGGQLRGRLVIGRYLGELWTVALSDDGESALTEETMLNESGGLDVAMAPDGTLVVAKNGEKRVTYLEPLELKQDDLVVTTVFPRRGFVDGGSPLHIYGKNLNAFGTPTVTVGGVNCPVSGTVTERKITCALPPGSGTADIVVTANDGQTSTFERGYRYITGGKPSSSSTTEQRTQPLALPSAITKFVLVDAMANEDIEGGLECVPVACAGSNMYLNIRAETIGPVDSVILDISGPKTSTNRDYATPYSLFGDLNGNYVGSKLPVGDYRVFAQIYDASGKAVGLSKSLNFTISDVQV